MSKIGFIDYYIDEWHANNYPAWIREAAAAGGKKWDVAYAWAETVKEGGMDTAAWCAEHNVQMIESLEEIVALSDALIVLSPDNPEHHERLAELALKSGKPVYIDKTFSPDLASGERMFALAAEHGTPLFSSSALRFSEELLQFAASDVLEFTAVTGPGQFGNYAVHQLEMIVALMGPGAKRMKSLSTANGRLFVIDYGDGRQATMQQLEAAPFQVLLQMKDGQGAALGCSNFFPGLIRAMLDFFESGKPPVPQAETLEIMALIEAGRRALAEQDQWVEI
ncbi:Gfo/Idh/MocA family protein [Paenibacillus sp. GCM10027626]|uniref:Gfo/Idh/MocA family protein n=1 Tax=Paenibacillus sp. GCM10027626 TaxID=3273411 RepID=UPI00362CCEAA